MRPRRSAAGGRRLAVVAAVAVVVAVVVVSLVKIPYLQKVRSSCFSKRRNGQTDGPTNRPSNRDARTNLKRGLVDVTRKRLTFSDTSSKAQQIPGPSPPRCAGERVVDLPVNLSHPSWETPHAAYLLFFSFTQSSGIPRWNEYDSNDA